MTVTDRLNAEIAARKAADTAEAAARTAADAALSARIAELEEQMVVVLAQPVFVPLPAAPVAVADSYLEMVLARPGVLGAWFFGDDTGGTFQDRSVANNDGTWTGTPNLALTSPIPFDPKAAVSLATSDIGTIPHIAAYNRGNGPFALEFWTNNGIETHTLVRKCDTTTDPGWQATIGGTSLMRLQDGNGSNNVRQATALAAGWNHYVLNRGDAASGTVYIDGITNHFDSASITFSDSGQPIIVSVNGGIYGLVYYDRVVSQAEAQQSYEYAYSEVPAPPATTYEGYGANVTGGEGHPVVTVRTTADSGTGSLREALAAGNRTIEFTVEGTINLLTQLNPSGDNVTVNGLSAPGAGITITGAPIFWSGRDNVIVTGLRFHDNDLVGTATSDNMTLKSGCTNFVIDHCSFNGATDGALDITLDCSDVTVQWCIIGPNVLTHNNLLQVARNTYRVSVHHNLFYDGETRMPQCGDADNPYDDGVTLTGDIRCNLIWAPGEGLYGTVVAANARANVVRNYYYLSVTGVGRTIHTETTGSAYANGNYDRRGEAFSYTSDPEIVPPAYATVTMEATAALAAQAVLDGAGCRAGGLDSRDQAKIDAINAAGL